jgi:hypothetical protein
LRLLLLLGKQRRQCVTCRRQCGLLALPILLLLLEELKPHRGFLAGLLLLLQRPHVIDPRGHGPSYAAIVKPHELPEPP